MKATIGFGGGRRRREVEFVLPTVTTDGRLLLTLSLRRTRGGRSEYITLEVSGDDLVSRMLRPAIDWFARRVPSFRAGDVN